MTRQKQKQRFKNRQERLGLNKDTTADDGGNVLNKTSDDAKHAPDAYHKRKKRRTSKK